jgi:Protein of unknown function (DUF3768)
MTSQNHDARLSSADDRAAIIRKLNDAFRKGHGNGTLAITDGVLSLGQHAVNDVVQQVQLFDDFSADNDPYREHDFGAFQYQGQKLFWKIDYYDRDCLYGSEDPTDPNVTRRVMTIMLAREY